jgi:hypothetical protein
MMADTKRRGSKKRSNSRSRKAGHAQSMKHSKPRQKKR